MLQVVATKRGREGKRERERKRGRLWLKKLSHLLPEEREETPDGVGDEGMRDRENERRATTREKKATDYAGEVICVLLAFSLPLFSFSLFPLPLSLLLLSLDSRIAGKTIYSCYCLEPKNADGNACEILASSHQTQRRARESEAGKQRRRQENEGRVEHETSHALTAGKHI